MTISDNTASLQSLLETANALPEYEEPLDTSDATATAADILSGETAYVNGEKVTGTIATKTSSDVKASGSSITVPAGYYASAVTKSMPYSSKPDASIDVSSTGLITTTVTYKSGYLPAGTVTETEQLPVQEAKTVTPSTSDQTAVASGVYATGEVKVAGDANLAASNIKSGVSIFGVSGSVVEQENLDDAMATQDSLISQIQTALQGKATGGGGGSFEATELVVDSTQFTYDPDDYQSYDIFYTSPNGEAVFDYGDVTEGLRTYSVARNTVAALFFYGAISQTRINVSGGEAAVSSRSDGYAIKVAGPINITIENL